MTIATNWDVAKTNSSLANGCRQQQLNYQSGLSIEHLVCLSATSLPWNYNINQLFNQLFFIYIYFFFLLIT